MCKFATDKQVKEIIHKIISSSKPKNIKSAYETFIEFTNKYHIDISHQVITENNTSEIICNCLFLINPGASANVILTELNETTINQLTFFANQLENLDIGFLQCIINENEIEKEKILQKAGFRLLCPLNIMEANLLKNTLPNIENNSNINWLKFTDTPENEFENIIWATYENSLDCPEITGLRTKREILIGHKYSGDFTPRFWKILQCDNKNAGIILLNQSVEQSDRLDLIYMGIVPEFRGRKLAKTMLTRTMIQAKNNAKTKMCLAVDSRNIPAINLYRKLGFCTIQRQKVFAILNEKRRMKIKSQYKETNNG